MCYVPKAAAEACVGRIIAVLEHHRRQIVCPRLWKIQSYKNLFRHQCSDWDRNNNACCHFWAHLERMSMYYLGDNFVFWKKWASFLSMCLSEGTFLLLLFFKKEMFSSLVQIFAVSMSSDSRQQSNELHTNLSHLFKVGQAAFKVRNKIASTESHGTRSWIGWLGGSFYSDWASGIPWPYKWLIIWHFSMHLQSGRIFLQRNLEFWKLGIVLWLDFCYW